MKVRKKIVIGTNGALGTDLMHVLPEDTEMAGEAQKKSAWTRRAGAALVIALLMVLAVEAGQSPLRKPRYSVLENGALKQAQVQRDVAMARRAGTVHGDGHPYLRTKDPSEAR